MRRTLGTLLLLSAAALPVGSTESRMERYRELLHERRQLERENAILTFEAKRASRGAPYLLLDLETGVLDFRIRGMSLKTYKFSNLSGDAHARRLDVASVSGRLNEPLTIVEIQGGTPELVPPDPEAGRETGLLYSDPEQLASETGAVEVDTDAGLLGVDAPTEYFIRLEGDEINVVLHLRSRLSSALHQVAWARLTSAIGSLWRGGSDGTDEGTMALYLTTDGETAKLLHHSLIPGETVFVLPPSPRPIVVTAETGAEGGSTRLSKKR